MKYFLLVLLLGSNAMAYGNHTNGYVRRDGTYVQPYEHSQRDNNPYNNYTPPKEPVYTYQVKPVYVPKNVYDVQE